MYNVGDLVLYGSTGVCKIMEIAQRKRADTDEAALYYRLKPLYQECVIYAPVDSDKIFIRPIISREEADGLIDSIPNIEVEMYHNPVVNELTRHYDESLKTFDCANLVELTMSIYAKKRYAESQKRKFGTVDEKFMRKAEDLLFGELAAALNIPRDSVQDYISERLEGQAVNYR